ncbi:hypothetical protein KPH14_000840 [Odynerus spinipes]|uniref:PiggyBac transposable element-derived protein domain-containing protein n=1 Tax=Odynerus spinipes TaxID=1348599 RepID=A0AAD9RFH0_9HYME|nr:hypothetical protein KPH14_000840 [Odynerus spinipes]
MNAEYIRHAESEEIEENCVESAAVSNLVWTTEKFKPKVHNFNPRNSGIQTGIKISWKIIDYFQLFVSEELMEYIVEKTNSYWQQKKNNNEILTGTNLSELYCFIAICLLMTCNKRLSLAEHWSRDKLLRSDIFSDIMSRDRYFLLLRMLYFSDNQVSSSDRLGKIRKIIDELRAAFSNTFYLFSNLCIDESLLLYKGRLSFKQFIPSKRNRFGIKSFVLCDCKTGYIQDFIVYTGGDTTIGPKNKDYGKSGSMVMSLLEPYLGKGHTLYVDNWYTSPALFDVLHKNYTNACGIVKKRRKGMPKMDEKLKKGEACFRSAGNMLAIKWQDKKEVWMISTVHKAEFADVKKRYSTQNIVQKPSCVLEYNKLMDAVDKTDMVISTIHSTRKTIKCSPALFNLLHTNVTNACGTVKRRRKGMPVMDRKLEKGEVDFRISSNLLALKWRDKRDVLMLSTFHTSEFISTGKRNYRTQEIASRKGSLDIQDPDDQAED